MTSITHVCILLTGADEGSTPLEAASQINTATIKVTVIDFFKASDKTHGVDVQSLNATSKYDISAYWRLLQHLKVESPDVLHVHPNAVGALARIIARIIGIDCLVTTEHNTHEKFGLIRNIVNGGTNWLNDVVVANSEATAESFRQWERFLLSLSGCSIEVIHYGANIEAIGSAMQENASPPLPDGFLVVAGGRLAEQKNLSSLIQAIGIVRHHHEDIHLVITGDGPKRNELEELVSDLEIEDGVTFLGWLPERTDVYTVYNEASVFAFPSYYEGFGVANAEAMATGTPVIVNDIPVLREVVGNAGIFVDATDPEVLANSIISLYKNPERRSELGKKAAERIREHFSLSQTVRQYNEVYQKCNNE